MLGPSPTPGPTGEWIIDIHGSFVSTFLRPQLRTDRLFSLALAKWVFPFSLPCVESNYQVRPGPSSLTYHRQKEQTEKNISVDRGSSYCAYLY